MSSFYSRLKEFAPSIHGLGVAMARFPVSRALLAVLLLLSAFQFSLSDLQAAPVAYSGKLTIWGFAHDGPGHFRFQLIDHNGTVLWQNAPDGAAVTTQVTRGHYSVLLGDDTTPNMAALPPRLFLDHAVVFLRVHFSQGEGKPFLHLKPDQRILSVAHALTADTAKLADVALVADVADVALVADVADAVQAGAITREMLSHGVLADLDRTVVITREMLPPDVLADLNNSIVVTRDMLPPEVLADLNKTIVLTRDMLPLDVLDDLNRPIVVTREMLPQDVLDDLNGTISRWRLAADVLADLNKTIVITRGMLPPDVLADLNETIVITREMLPPDVLAELNATVIQPGSITRDQLAPDVRADLNKTIVITREMLPPDVLADLNSTVIQPGGVTLADLAPEVLAELNATISRWRLAPDVLVDLNGTIPRWRLSQDVLDDLNKTIVITREMLPQDVLDDLNGTIPRWRLSVDVLDDLNKTVVITREMLPADVLADLNGTIPRWRLAQDVLDDLNKTVVITREMLPQDVLDDLNGTIPRWRLAQDVLDDLNKTVVITREMLPQDVLDDLNGTIPRWRLSVDVLDDLNGTIPRWRLASDVLDDLNKTVVITREMLPQDVLDDLNKTVVITREMLPQDVLDDLNGTIPRWRLSVDVLDELNGTTVAAAPAGSLIAVSAGQNAPAGYSLYQQGEPKTLVWEEKAPVSVARSAFDGVEVLDGKIYFVGGYGSAGAKNTAERYDSATNQWETLNAMSAARQGVAAAILNGKLYAIGGQDLSSVEVFDPVTGQWSAGLALPSEVNHGTAITLGGKILLVGGQNSADQIISQVLELDPATNQWSQKAPMPTARYGHKLVHFDGKIWAIGGHDGSTILNKVEIYDVTNDSWTTGPSLTIARNWASAWVANGRIYVAGGHNGAYLNSIEAYDPATNQWVALGSLPENVEHADAAVLGDKVYLVAGYNGSAFTNKVYAADVSPVFDLYFRDGNASAGGATAEVSPGSITADMLAPGLLADLNASASAGDGNGTVTIPAGSLIAVQAGQSAPAGYSLYQAGEPNLELTWEEKASVSVARQAFDGVEALDGKIYVVGGQDGSSAKNIAERYDPATNQWETLAPMSVARKYLAAAVLNGKIYAIGGMGLSSVEIFDPATGQWSAGPALPSEVQSATAITVGGKILLVGGAGSSGNLDQVLSLDPATNQWSQKAPMPTARHAMKLVFLDGKVWAIGGHDGIYINKVEIYDPAANSWTTGPSLTTARHWPSAWAANDRIFVVSGHDGSSYLNSIEVYDPVTNQWTAAGNLPEIKYAADAAILGGKVYVVAGRRTDNDYSNKVYAADLNASMAGVFDLYFRDGNASAGGATVSAEVGDGTVTTSKLSSEVVAALKPVILQQPQSVVGVGGTTATFVTQATGGNLTYQWRQQGFAIAGGIVNVLTITDLNATLHDGNYTVTVTNAFGSTESAVATLEVVMTLEQGLLAYYPFDGNASDMSGNNHHGTPHNGVALGEDRHGRAGKAYSFDGVDDYISLPDIRSSFNQSASISLWAKVTSRYEGNPKGGLVHFGTGSNLHYSYPDGTIYMNALRSNSRVGPFSATTDLSKWHMFCVTSDTGSTWRMYLNTTLAKEEAATEVGIPAQAYIAKSIGDITYYLHGSLDDVRIYDRALSATEVTALYNLGSGESTTTTTGGTTTIVAEVGPGSITTEKLSETILKYLRPEITAAPQTQAVFEGQSATLSASAEGKFMNYQWKKDGVDLLGETNATLVIQEVNATAHDGNYSVVVSNDFGSVEGLIGSFDVNSTWSTTGLVGWWKFDDSSGTVATDSSGNGHNGALIGNPTWVAGKIGGALSFDGAGDYMEVPSRKWNFENVATVSLWYFLNQIPSSNGTAFSLGSDPSNDEILLYLRPSNDFKIYQHKSGGNFAALLGQSTTNAWVHFTGTIDGGFAESQMRIYSNGQLLSATYSTSGSPALLSDANDRKLRIGRRITSYDDLNGLIDDVRIYDRPLSAEEIQALYQSGN